MSPDQLDLKVGGSEDVGSCAVRAIQWLLGAAYRWQALIVDIGSCMRHRLEAFDTGVYAETFPPWVLAELPEPAPIDQAERQMLFGDARLGLLYSGVFGRAHSWAGLPELARALAAGGGRIAFSVGGNAAEDLRKSMQESGVPVKWRIRGAVRIRVERGHLTVLEHHTLAFETIPLCRIKALSIQSVPGVHQTALAV